MGASAPSLDSSAKTHICNLNSTRYGHTISGFLFPAVPRRLFCFGSLVVLNVVCGYFLLVLLDIFKQKLDKNTCLQGVSENVHLF